MKNLNKTHLRKMILREFKESSGEKEHRCFGGDTVQFGSGECIADIEMRIDDATHQRNGCNIRTDSRDYYNGLLKVLRRDFRAANKEGQIMHPTVEEEPGLSDPVVSDEAELNLEDLEDLIVSAL